MATTERTLKKSSLRNNEYYDIQDDYDRLYEQSKKSHIFKNLLELIADERNIKLAFRNIKNNPGSTTAGTNGTTIEDWANKDVDVFIKYIQNRIANYQPSTVRRVERLKPNGKTRPLGIPTIEDRLIQQCIKQVLEPICEAKFHHNSYGFRPNRSTNDALACMLKYINKSHLYYVVDMDIKGFFDNVNHGKLLKQMWAIGIRDKNLLCIISKMLKAEIDGIGIPEKGTPQGGILSPLLSNIVLNELDWWISDQWETFETKHDYTTTRKIKDDRPDNGHKFRALRNSKMKEVYIVRYADDFKLICRNREDAEKIFIAVQKWLQERLNLEISDEKSKVVNIKRSSSEFLGFRIKTKIKRKKIVVTTRMSEKAFKACKDKLKKKVCDMQKNPTAKTVGRYNSTVLGMQNYYKSATDITIDMSKIAFIINKTIRCRLRQKQTNKGFKSEAYKNFYKNKSKEIHVAEITLFPIADIRHVSPMLFTQKKCDYTKQGRELIHSSLKGYDIRILKYLLENPVLGKSIEYNDNRISLYTGQQGKCGITKEILEIGNMEAHHKIPIKKGGTDEYKNLVFIKGDVHKLIHATEQETIEKYYKVIMPNKETLKKINKLRNLVGNIEITEIV